MGQKRSFDQINSNYYEEAATSCEQADEKSFNEPRTSKSNLVCGKWSCEEERYAAELILAFESGTLDDCEEGTTLRSYLSKKLNCAPMRISKKFAGTCIGKLVYCKKTNQNYRFAVNGPSPTCVQMGGYFSMENISRPLSNGGFVASSFSNKFSTFCHPSASSTSNTIYCVDSFNNFPSSQVFFQAHETRSVEEQPTEGRAFPDTSSFIINSSINSMAVRQNEFEIVDVFSDHEAKLWKSVLLYYCGNNA